MKSDMLVKMVLVFFISLLSFSIGTFVGKKFSDNQHKISGGHGNDSATVEHGDAHAAAPAEHGSEHGAEDRGTASVDPAATQFKPGQPLTDDEIAQLAEEFVDDKAPAADAHGDKSHGDNAHSEKAHDDKSHADNSHAAANDHAETHETAKSGAHHEPMMAADKVAHNKAPAVQKTAAKIPADLPKQVAASALNKFTVQVASYAAESEAQKFAGDLKTKGYSAFYVPAQVNGQTWYRVSVGLFATQKEAQEYRSELMQNAKVSSAIVQKINQ